MLKYFSGALTMLMLVLGSASIVQAASYDYDALGRLVRSIDSQGRVTEYVYDPAGNLLQVIHGANAQPPAVSTVAPPAIRRNRTLQMQITGSGLVGASVTPDDPAVRVVGVSTAQNQISFRVIVPRDSAVGPRSFTLRNAAGTTSAAFQVLPEMEYTVGPPPFAIPPDGSTRQYRFEAPVPEEHALEMTVSSVNAAIARPGSASVLLPTGATQATGTVVGVAAGTTRLRFSSPTLVDPIEVQVEVTNDFAAGSVARSRALGIVRGDPSAPGAATPSRAPAPLLGIVKGNPAAPGANTPAGVAAPLLGITREN